MVMTNVDIRRLRRRSVQQREQPSGFGDYRLLVFELASAADAAGRWRTARGGRVAHSGVRAWR